MTKIGSVVQWEGKKEKLTGKVIAESGNRWKIESGGKKYFVPKDKVKRGYNKKPKAPAKKKTPVKKDILTPKNMKFWKEEIIEYNYGGGLKDYSLKGFEEYYKQLWGVGANWKAEAESTWEKYKPSNFSYLTNLADNPHASDFRGSGFEWDPKIKRFYNVLKDMVIDVDGYRKREGYKPSSKIITQKDIIKEREEERKAERKIALKEERERKKQFQSLFQNVPQETMNDLSKLLRGAYK